MIYENHRRFSKFIICFILGEIALKDVLAVEYMNTKCHCVRIHHVVKYSNKRLRSRTLDLTGDESSCKMFKDALKLKVNGE